MIRLLIVDDHHVVRTGLSQLFAAIDDIDVVDCVASGEEALAVLPATSPDVVLMDLSMPDLDGIETTRRVIAAQPAVRVVVLTSFSDRERILDALDAGAIGYLLKDATPEELVRGVRAASRGESPLDPKAASTLLSARTRSAATDLTDREQEILQLVASGLPNKVIALRLGISEKTVKAHLTRVFSSIGVTDRTQAALWAQRHGSG
jgi:DNA-binding NarL/FixJ family response regulator